MSNRTTETELRRLEERVYRLPVDDLERRVAALEQGVAQQSGRVGACIRSYTLSMLGLSAPSGMYTGGYPLPAGETVTYGPIVVPYDPGVAFTSGVTDASGVVTFITINPTTTFAAFTLLNPRFDISFLGGPTLETFQVPALCGDTIVTSHQAGTDSVNPYVASNLITPYPVKKTLGLDVATLGITGMVLTWSAASGTWFGTASASFGGCAGTCAAATVDVTVTLQMDVGTSDVKVYFDYKIKTVGGHTCPDPTGTNSHSLLYTTAAMAPGGSGLSPTGLTITVPGAGSGGGPIFCNGATPTLVFYEV